eukprot:6199160-Pleurochrysis_carterae.AAC.5
MLVQLSCGGGAGGARCAGAGSGGAGCLSVGAAACPCGVNRAAHSASEPAMSARAALSLLSRHRRWRVTYLERLLEQLPQPPLVWEALLEDYLSASASKSLDTVGTGSHGFGERRSGQPAEAASNADADAPDLSELDGVNVAIVARGKALDLLRHPSAAYSEDHAMLLCAHFGCDDGLALLYERKGLHAALLRHFARRHRHADVVRTCHRFGEREPALWTEALHYLSSLKDPNVASFAELHRLVGEVINAIERERLLPPLAVLDALSVHASLPFSAVREYALRHVEHDSAMLEEATRESARYEEESRRMADEMDELATKASVFQLSKCSACHNPLELPTVHFLCLHSFHHACLGDRDEDCPCCAPQRGLALRRLQQQKQRASAHGDFFKQLELSSDGFTTIASYFGCGMFGHNQPNASH